MTYVAKEYMHNGCRIRIISDEDPPHPRKDWDNLTTMACWHGRYNLGDEQPKESPREYLYSLAREVDDELDDIQERVSSIEDHYYPDEDHWCCVKARAYLSKRLEFALDQHYLIRTLHLYDHSGITISMSGFSCPWDSGPVGYVVMPLAKAEENWSVKGWDAPVPYPDGSVQTLRERALGAMRGEVETYDQYLTGDVWGYEVTYLDDDGEELGEDSCWGFYGVEYCQSEAEMAADSVVEQWKKQSTAINAMMHD